MLLSHVSFIATALTLVWLPLAAEGQDGPRVRLEGRESVGQMKEFAPFLGRWLRTESPPGTPLERPGNGGCFFREASHGMAVDVGCGPWDSPAEGARVFWHPVDRVFVFRLYSVFNPIDLLFEGVYEFPTPESVRRTYKGYYGDGRIHLYRETWTLEAPDRLVQKTERFRSGKWEQLFGGSAYQRIDG